MTAVGSSLLLALGQLADARVIRILLKSTAVTVVIVIAIGLALWGLLDAALDAWIIPNLPSDYGDTVAQIIAVSVGVIGGWLLFRIVALAVINFFADEVVQAVEARYYPEAAKRARDLPVREQVSTSLRTALRALAFNLLALPFALVLLFTGIGPALLFWALNAVLVGRELQDMVWLRHRQGKADPAPVGRGERYLLGGAVAALLALPFVNLLAPILGAAAATHLIHRKERP